MINIIKKNNIITISGHANYSDKEDIVCASVSSIMYTTVNALLRVDRNSIDYKDDGKVVTIEVNKNDDLTNILIVNMLSLFNELALKYKDNIKIEMEEERC